MDLFIFVLWASAVGALSESWMTDGPTDHTRLQIGSHEVKREWMMNDLKAKLRALDGGVCPKSLPAHGIGADFDYGIGCAFVEKNLAGAEGKGCRCPSVLDVCATEPRFRSVRQLDPMADRTVPVFGYCRTGAWVFALGGMLLLGALGGTAVLLKRRSRVDVSRREAGHTPAKAAVA
ncbi:unnamed protein product [Durusdinium trenchii]|uniref:Uncharacterized protein n=1 Tax=Durusdinium trenchii TaxID=1381693 RepID=A0ABP0P9A1_9DINO